MPYHPSDNCYFRLKEKLFCFVLQEFMKAIDLLSPEGTATVMGWGFLDADIPKIIVYCPDMVTRF